MTRTYQSFCHAY